MNKSTSALSVPTDELLAERGTTHGDFTDNAKIMQALKRITHKGIRWADLSDVQREAIDMITHKLGRILTGNPDHRDHWDDIAGYARLVSQRLEGAE